VKRRNPNFSVIFAGDFKSLRGFQGFTLHTVSHREEQEQVNSSELSQSDIEKKVSEHLAAAGLEFSEDKTQPILFGIRCCSSKSYPASAAGMK